ncbi:MAG: hypothetical protein ACFFBI_05825 [Promethearchaeota archaeon]
MPRKKRKIIIRTTDYLPTHKSQYGSYQQQDINARRVLPASEISPQMRFQTPQKPLPIRSIKDIIIWLLNILPF